MDRSKEGQNTTSGNSFSVYYGFDANNKDVLHVGTDHGGIIPSSLPDSVEPQGGEVVGDYTTDARWHLYWSCQSIREEEERRKRLKVDSEQGEEGNHSHEQLEEVVQSLIDARSELDVIRDVVTVLEDQQQFLAMMHIPHSAVQHTAKRDGLIRQGIKKAQMHSIAQRLRSGANTLKQKYCERLRFFEDVEYLKKRWLVRECEMVGNVFGEDCVMIDISMPVEDDFDWLRHTKKSLGKYLFIVSSSDDEIGEACGLLQDPESSTGEENVVVGREEIDRVLQKLKDMRAWKLICRVLDVESDDLSNRESLRGIIHPDVQSAVMVLAHSMLPGQQHAAGQQQDICSDPHMQYVADFYATEMCPILFQKKALLTLENAMAWHHVPDIICETTTTTRKTFLEQLCDWMKSSSMWHDAAVLTSGKDAMSSPLIEYIRLSAERVTCLPATIHVLSREKRELGSFVIQGNYSISWVPTSSHVSTHTSRVERLQVRQMLESNNSFISIVEY